MTEHTRRTLYRRGRRIGVILAGVAVTFVGVAMIVLPGPAVLVIPLGLGILGLELPWAHRWAQALRAMAARVGQALRRRAVAPA